MNFSTYFAIVGKNLTANGVYEKLFAGDISIWSIISIDKRTDFMNLLLTGAILALLIALASGIAMALQGSLNASLAKIIGLLESTFIVHASAAILLIVMIFVLRMGQGDFGSYNQAPWYLYLGGAIGIAITVGVMFSIPKLGVATATTAIIVGQVTTAALVDHFGLFGLQKIPFTWIKLAGIVLLAAGAKFMLIK